MDKLPRAMGGGSPYSLALNPSKGGLALQEANTQHSLQQLSYDPSFAERAAKYSTFGNSRFPQGGYSAFDTGRLRDVLESESMRAIPHHGNSFSSEDETKPKSSCERGSPTCLREEAIEGAKSKGLVGNMEAVSSEGLVSQENSSGSAPPAAIVAATGTAAASAPQRKRKGNASSDSKSVEVLTEQTSSGLKRQRSADGKPKAERSGSENSGDSSPRSTLKGGATSKAPPQSDGGQQQLPNKQDYIHVRARRGQATDSHSLAERVRREKISERMKFLQDLVPGCSKVTGKAVMLDEIINYVQSLQRQIEFLSMKLAAVNPRLDYNYEQLLGKELLLSRSPETTLLGPDPLGYSHDLHGHGHGQLPLPLPHFSSLEGLGDAFLRRSMGVPSMASLVSDDQFCDPLSQAVNLCNGDLQSVVEMGFIQGRQGLGFGTQLSHGSSMCLPGKLKVELG